MKTQSQKIQNFIYRFLFIHAFISIYQILISNKPTHYFPSPNFTLFTPISKKYHQGYKKLVKNLISTFINPIIKGILMTFLYVFLNIALPKVIKMFMHAIHGDASQQHQIQQAQNLIKIIVVVQIFRILLYQHSKKYFHELAIRIQSTLSSLLIQKSLNLSQKVHQDIPQSSIYQLENLDIKLIYNMFNNLMLIFEAPLTITIALIILFLQNIKYGFIGIYWFVIVFLLHRELNQKMMHCNKTKLNLIDIRSKTNYQLLSQIKQAKLIGWDNIIIDKNNSLFEQQNHDHLLFYSYITLYDILLLIFPTFVLISIYIVDISEINHVTVQEVFLLLSLLTICYQPMKSIRTISISIHDGLHALYRIQRYFNMPESSTNKQIVVDNGSSALHLFILKQTKSTYNYYNISIKHQIDVTTNERIIILSKNVKDQISFFKMINGFSDKIQGKITMSGRKAILSDKFFFLKKNVKNNITFYNQQISQRQIQQISTELGIRQQLTQTGGISTSMDDISIFSNSLLQRISLVRVFCSNAQIYMLNQPFKYLSNSQKNVVDKILRKKQNQSKILVIISMKQLSTREPKDKIGIIDNGVMEQYGTYQQLMNNKQSSIFNYINKQQNIIKLSNTPKSDVQNQIITNKSAIQNQSNKIQNLQDANNQDNCYLMTTNLQRPLSQNLLTKNITQNKQQITTNIFFCIKYLMTLISPTSIFFISTISPILVLIIISAQLLHVFLHLYTDHLEEQYSHHIYLNFTNMIIVEVVLTLGLSGIIYYQGEVSSIIAVIQGNEIYKNSLLSLTNKKLQYFINEYPIKTADKLNHDYQQIYIVGHSINTIYQNVILVIISVIIVSNNSYTVLILTGIFIYFYSIIYIIYKQLINKIAPYYYHYKYKFVKCFDQSLNGSQYFTIFNKKCQLLKYAQSKYIKLSSFKQVQCFIYHTLSIICQVFGNMLLALIIYYSLQLKINKTKTNFILLSTSIHILINISSLIKNIIIQIINLQMFFHINIIPLMEINLNQQQWKSIYKSYQKFNGFSIQFKNIKLQSHKPINLTIKEGQHICIYQSNYSSRNLLLYTLTNSIAHPSQNVLIGGIPISTIFPKQLHKAIGIILTKNFYHSGTLKDNIIRNIDVNQQDIISIIKQIQLDKELQHFNQLGLNSIISFNCYQLNQLFSKKLALARVIVNQSKIVIIKDTSIYIGQLSILSILKHHLPNSTIIIINDHKQQQLISNQYRVIHLKSNTVISQPSRTQAIKKDKGIIQKIAEYLHRDNYLFGNGEQVIKKLQ